MLNLSIIIPFKDKAAMTIKCLRTLLEFGPDIKEVILVSNNSVASELELVRSAVQAHENTQLLIYNHPFNYQSINNWAAARSTGKVIMLLNNDIELMPESKGLLEVMYHEALKPKVGAVGCVLVYEDKKTIQHGGVYLVAGGTADHLYIGKSLKRTLDAIHQQPEKMPNIETNLPITAVTAAAVMVERPKYEAIGGLNEAFIICGGDVDLCLRLREHGYNNMLIGAQSGYMMHKESKSRSLLAVPYIDFVESYKSYSRHFDVARGDPEISQEEIRHGR